MTRDQLDEYRKNAARRKREQEEEVRTVLADHSLII
jgi:hypothetical protein